MTRQPSFSSATSPEDHARHIGEACNIAWAKAHADTRLNVPMSVLAALTLVGQCDSRGPDLTSQLLQLSTDEWMDLLRGIWRQFASAHPDLIPAAFPLIEWLFQDISPKVSQGAWDVAQAVLKVGIIHLTGTDQRYEVDTLGIAWTLLLPPAARTADAKYYTPGPVAEMMATMVGLPAAGESVNDPTCGTGGLFRAVARQMRLAEKDPSSVVWIGTDIDELAVACCAVSSVAWGLGRRVILAVCDVLRDPDEPIERALAMRRECLDLAARVQAIAALTTACRQVQALLEDTHSTRRPQSRRSDPAEGGAKDALDDPTTETPVEIDTELDYPDA